MVIDFYARQHSILFPAKMSLFLVIDPFRVKYLPPTYQHCQQLTAIINDSSP